MKGIFKKVVIIGASIISTSAFADPFSSEWNWQNDKVVGPVKEISQIDSKTKKAHTTAYYAKDGLKTKNILFDKKGKADYTTVLEYNKSKQLIKITLNVAEKKEPIWIETATYKSKNMIKAIERKQGKIPSGNSEFKYDKNGLSSISLTNGSNSMTWHFKFSKDKNLLESSMSSSGKNRGIATYKFDKNNNPIKIISKYGKYGSVSTISYVYDKQKNWTSKTTTTQPYKDDKKTGKSRSYTTERKIIYYKK